MLVQKFPRTVLIVDFDEVRNFYHLNIIITNHKFCNSQVYVGSVDGDLARKFATPLASISAKLNIPDGIFTTWSCISLFYYYYYCY